MKRIFSLITVSVVCYATMLAWGSTGHKIINKNAVLHLPASMQRFIDSASYFEKHASDADNRIYAANADPTESYKHYLDIDYYPDYKNLTHDYDSLIAEYGYNVVWYTNGVLPWATVWALDSLTEQLKRGDWSKAFQTAADIGHYVGDGHQPLHVTKNYNGVETNQKGIHSRYESTMLDPTKYPYGNSIIITKDSVTYIADPLSYIFDYLYVSNTYVDSVLGADANACPPSGYNGSGPIPADYYSKLWGQTKNLTENEFESATVAVANLWYTAWVNAGLISMPTNINKGNISTPESFSLYQNYPNPFNPTTTIRFSIPQKHHIQLSIYDVMGKKLAVLADADYPAGEHSLRWNAEKFPSGIYFCRLESETFFSTKKLLYLK
jgi:hypothetical protein